ncbi:hypothetical protein [Lactiplantibacillus daowaiensis]|uniref:Uncharacterized protein n=1 Tax=Lactiplantibacillus daowaiensis TaxID=2559918 RepID=A0ABW1RW44_9LACO|nr:hypothetical protein [Lactiplantibacillus daowaiensis]
MSNQPTAVATLYFKLHNRDGYYQLRCECGPNRFVVNQIHWPALKHLFSPKFWHKNFRIDKAMIPLLVADLMAIVQPWQGVYDRLDTDKPNHDYWEIILSNDDWETTHERMEHQVLHATNYIHRRGDGAYPPDFEQLLTILEHYLIQ